LRIREIDTISSVPRGDRVRLLTLALSNKNPAVRILAAEALGSYGAVTSVAPLISALQRDRNPMVRLLAAESLGLIGDKRAVPFLIRALRDDSALVRGWAADSLAQIGSSRSAHEIERALQSERSANARVFYHAALYRLGDTGYLDHLIADLGSRSYRVRSAAAVALRGLAPGLGKAVSRVRDAVTKALEEESTIAAKEALRLALSVLKRTHVALRKTHHRATRPKG
jgi:HEAT repeat protein